MFVCWVGRSVFKAPHIQGLTSCQRMHPSAWEWSVLGLPLIVHISTIFLGNWIHPFKKYLLSIYFVSGPVPKIGITVRMKTKFLLALNLHSSRG